MKSATSILIAGILLAAGNTAIASPAEVPLLCRGIHKSEIFNSRPLKTEESSEQIVFRVAIREYKPERPEIPLSPIKLWTRDLPVKTMLLQYPLDCSGFESSITCTHQKSDTSYAPTKRLPNQTETIFREIATIEKLEVQIDRKAGVLKLDSTTELTFTNPPERVRWSSKGLFECQKLGDRKF
jgi:hypothetical protein